MRISHAPHRPRRIRPGAALSAVVALVAAAGIGVASHAAATYYPVLPTGIAVNVSTPNTGLGGAVPDVLVQVGQPMNVTISLLPAGSAFQDDTDLDLTPTLFGGGTPAGAFDPATVTLPAGVTSQTYAVSYSAVDNQVVVNVAVASTSALTSEGYGYPSQGPVAPGASGGRGCAPATTMAA